MCEISVIIPVYDLEHCIERTVRCIQDGSWQDFEMILVDDGSKDDSLAVCKRLAEDDKRIRVFRKENGGAGSARNLGLDNAEGRYIAFIDGDDLVEKDYLEKLYKRMNADDLDWVVCNYREVAMDEDNIVEPDRTHPAFYVDFISKGDEAHDTALRSVFFSPTGNNFHSNAMSLYKRSIVEEHCLRFHEDITFGEDTIFNYEYAHFVYGLSYITEPLYMYVQHDDSSKHVTFRESRIDRFFYLISWIDRIQDEYGDGWTKPALLYVFRQIYYIIRGCIMPLDKPEERLKSYDILDSYIQASPFDVIFKKIGRCRLQLKGRVLYSLLMMRRYELLDKIWINGRKIGIIEK